MYFTAADFARGSRCPALMWSLRRNKIALPATSQSVLLEFYGALARESYLKLHSGIEELPPMSSDQEAAQSTAEWIASGSGLGLRGAAAVANNCLARTDVLYRECDGFRLVHFTPATSPKVEHEEQLGFTAEIFRQCDIPITSFFVQHVNPDHVGGTRTEAHRLADLTNAVRARLPDTVLKLERFLSQDRREIAPPISAAEWGMLAPEERAALGSPEDSVYAFYGMRAKTAAKLAESFGPAMRDVPADVLSPDHLVQRLLTIHHRDWAVSSRNSILAFLDRLKGRVTHLDFETIASPVPLLAGTRPYEETPFAFSITNERQTFSFVAPPQANDPRPALVEALVPHLRESDTVVAFNTAFEKSVLNNLADAFPRHAPCLRSAADTLVDLMPVVRRSGVTLRGPTRSLKAASKLLFGTDPYASLNIRDGTTCALVYHALRAESAPDPKRMADIDAYVRTDTAIMPPLVEKLREVAGAASSMPSLEAMLPATNRSLAYAGAGRGK